MLTADVQLNEFNRGINRYVTRLKLDSRRVMKKELAELVKTLVKVSPPKDRTKSINSVKAQVAKKFDKWRNQQNNFATDATKESKTGLKYWAANSKFLFAGAADADLTKATIQELRSVYYRSRKQSGSMRLIVPFRHPRKLQKVAITSKIVTTEKQVKALGQRIAQNFGRLKAAWLSPVVAGVITLAGRYVPPGWVKKHMNGARGKFINQLTTPDRPSFTLINQAKGVTGRAAKFYTNLALKIRAKAMKKNFELIMLGKKEYTY